MTHSLHFLKSYRERTGVSLQDMANIIGIDVGNLSKVENQKLEPSLSVILAYHIILKIPIEKLFKNHYPEVTKNYLRNGITLKDKLLEGMSSPHIDKRLILVDTIIDRLVELDNGYGQ